MLWMKVQDAVIQAGGWDWQDRKCVLSSVMCLKIVWLQIEYKYLKRRWKDKFGKSVILFQCWSISLDNNCPSSKTKEANRQLSLDWVHEIGVGVEASHGKQNIKHKNETRVIAQLFSIAIGSLRSSISTTCSPLKAAQHLRNICLALVLPPPKREGSRLGVSGLPVRRMKWVRGWVRGADAVPFVSTPCNQSCSVHPLFSSSRKWQLAVIRQSLISQRPSPMGVCPASLLHLNYSY